MYLDFLQNPEHFKKMFRLVKRLKNARYIEDMMNSLPFFEENERELLFLLDKALLTKNLGFLPKLGGLEKQDFWFVLMLDAVTKFLNETKAKNGGAA